MPTTTTTLIATTTLTSDASTVTFSNIPNTYAQLLIKVMIQTTRRSDGFADVGVRFNGNSNAVYRSQLMNQTGGAVGASNVTSNDTNISFGLYSSLVPGDANYLLYFGQGEMLIPNYAGTNEKPIIYKTVTVKTNTYQMRNLASSFRTNTPITSITFVDNNSANMLTGSKFWVYGLKSS